MNTYVRCEYAHHPPNNLSTPLNNLLTYVANTPIIHPDNAGDRKCPKRLNEMWDTEEARALRYMWGCCLIGCLEVLEVYTGSFIVLMGCLWVLIGCLP